MNSMLPNLAVLSPPIIASVIGIIVAIILNRRSPAAAALTIVALVIWLTNVIVTTAVQSLLVSRLRDGVVEQLTYVRILRVVAVLSSLARASSIAMLVCAVFTGRGPKK